MSDHDHIVSVLRRGVADLAGERPEPAEIRAMLEGAPREAARRRRVGTFAVAAVVLAAVTFAAVRSGPVENGSAAFEGIELPLLQLDPGTGFSKEKFRATLVIREQDAELRLDYEPADAGPRKRPRTKWEPLPAPAGAGEGELPALRIAADGALPWHRVQRIAGPAMGARASFYLAGSGPDGKTAAIPLLVDPPPVARKLGATVTTLDLGLAKHPDAFRAIRVERSRGMVHFWFGPLGDLGDAVPFPALLGVALSPGMLVSGEPRTGLNETLVAELARMERIPTPRCGRSVVLIPASHTACVVDVLRAVELAGGDDAVMFWTSVHDRGVRTDGRGLARDLLRPYRSLEGDVVVGAPVAGAFRVDLPGRKGIACAPEKIPFPAERFERLVLHPCAATPWSACRSAVVQARRREAALAFRFSFGRVLPVPPPRGGRAAVEVRIGVSDDGRLTCVPGDEDLIGRDILVSASEAATAEDVFQTVQFLLWRGVAGVAFE